MIYILQLEQGKFYVGYTERENGSRFLEHFSGAGSKWTQIYKPIQVIEWMDGDQEDENRITLELMAKYGWWNVRGGKWCCVDMKKPPNELIPPKPLTLDELILMRDNSKEITKSSAINEIHQHMKNIFNNGDNDGDITIVTNNGYVHCHSFIITNHTKIKYDEVDKAISMPYSNKIIIDVFSFLYSGIIPENDYDVNDIINIHKIIAAIGCNCNTFKKYTAELFSTKLTYDNWIKLYIEAHDLDLVDTIYDYFKTQIIPAVSKNIINKEILYDELLKDDKIDKNMFIKILLSSIASNDAKIESDSKDDLSDSIDSKSMENKSVENKSVPKNINRKLTRKLVKKSDD